MYFNKLEIALNSSLLTSSIERGENKEVEIYKIKNKKKNCFGE